MKAILPKLATNLGLKQILPAQARLRLFRQSRSLAAGVMLLLFPMISALSFEPVAVMSALLLFGILPAAIALDARRPARLDRAVLIATFVAAIVLFAGTLRGLNGMAATALLAVMSLESALLVRSAARLKLLAITGVGATAMLAADLTVESVFGAGPWSSTAMLLALVINVMVILHAMSHVILEKNTAQKSIQRKGSAIDTVIAQTVLSIERSGTILHVSDNAARVLNIPHEALLGRGLVDLILVSERPALLKTLSDAAMQQKTCTVQLRMRASADDAAPRYRWVELIVSPSSENTAHLVGALRDIDAQMAEELQLERLEDEAAQAKLARSAFLSTINHELRTPLNAIIGFSEILSNPNTIPLDAMKTQEYATLIHGAGRDLFRKISAMVDVTRLDSGVYEIEKEPTEIRDLLESAIEAFRQEPDSCGVSIEFADTTTVSKEQSLDVDIDARAIRSVIHQLLSNAAKFAGTSKPIRVALTSSQDSVSICVKDSGPGIPPEKLELLGHHFARLDETLNRAHGGIGLGLSLTRGIMALHHGSMSFDSKPGKGTAVVLTLPRQASASAAPTNLIQLGSVRPQSLNSMSTDQPRSRRHG